MGTKDIALIISILVALASGVFTFCEKQNSKDFLTALEEAERIISFQKDSIQELKAENLVASAQVYRLNQQLANTPEGEIKYVTKFRTRTKVDTIVPTEEINYLQKYISDLQAEKDTLVERCSELLAQAYSQIDSLTFVSEFKDDYIDLVVESRADSTRFNLTMRDSLLFTHSIVPPKPFLGFIGRKHYRVDVFSNNPYRDTSYVESYEFKGGKPK